MYLLLLLLALALLLALQSAGARSLPLHALALVHVRQHRCATRLAVGIGDRTAGKFDLLASDDAAALFVRLF